jgi:hypothetical protein
MLFCFLKHLSCLQVDRSFGKDSCRKFPKAFSSPFNFNGKLKSMFSSFLTEQVFFQAFKVHVACLSVFVHKYVKSVSYSSSYMYSAYLYFSEGRLGSSKLYVREKTMWIHLYMRCKCSVYAFLYMQCICFCICNV